MSTFYRRTKRCAMCWSKSEYTEIGSTNTFGSPDLDLRPPEMQRSTMPYWVERCPKCGYVAYDISKKSAISRKWLKQPQYLSCEGHVFANTLAALFYKLYMIAKATNNADEAFQALLNAAWACDDQKDEENAVMCRKLLLPYLDQIIDNAGKKAETLLLVRADVLRRAGMFELVIEEYTDKVFADALLNSICQFEIMKARQKDSACYQVADVKAS